VVEDASVMADVSETVSGLNKSKTNCVVIPEY